MKIATYVYIICIDKSVLNFKLSTYTVCYSITVSSDRKVVSTHYILIATVLNCTILCCAVLLFVNMFLLAVTQI